MTPENMYVLSRSLSFSLFLSLTLSLALSPTQIELPGWPPYLQILYQNEGVSPVLVLKEMFVQSTLLLGSTVLQKRQFEASQEMRVRYLSPHPSSQAES